MDHGLWIMDHGSWIIHVEVPKRSLELGCWYRQSRMRRMRRMSRMSGVSVRLTTSRSPQVVMSFYPNQTITSNNVTYPTYSLNIFESLFNFFRVNNISAPIKLFIGLIFIFHISMKAAKTAFKREKRFVTQKSSCKKERLIKV